MPPQAVLKTLDRLWETAQPLGFPMALMGGLALSAWKHVRATQDVDLLAGASLSTVDSLMSSLLQAGFRPRSSPPVVSLGSIHLLQLEFEPAEAFIAVHVDLMLAESEYHREALRRRIALRIPDLDREVCVLSCEDLILHKLVAGRVIDRADAVALLRANHTTLDARYLNR